MGKLAAVGWLLAIAIGGAAFGGYQWLLADKQAALDAQAAEFEVKLAQVKAESATQLLGGLKVAQERNDVVVVQSDENVYWILPTEIEGLSLYHVPDGQPVEGGTFGIIKPS